jgi:beta-lactamase class A
MQRQASRTVYNNTYHSLPLQNGRAHLKSVPFGSNVVKYRRPKKKKVNPIARFCTLAMLGVLGTFVIPYGVKNVVLPNVQYERYPEIVANYDEIVNPISNYIYNSFFLNRRILTGSLSKTQMSDLYVTDEMIQLKSELQKLMAGYTKIQPSIFVWEYDSGKYVDINADKHFSAASIIKIPVLLETFRAIEANELSINEKMVLTEYYRSEGSGKMKHHKVGNSYTIDELARLMIEHSDNTATNMLIAAVGGMPRVNSAMKTWGINNTQIQNWLPDLAGTNYTTTKDLAKMLYNIENSNFLSSKSKNYIFDYMGHVENNRLIQAGLGEGAKFVHKTGDIGGTLGDSGIVTTANGKKYIVSIIANRPYNSPLGKNFIVSASNIIYNYISSGRY